VFWLGHLLAWDSRGDLTRSIPDGILLNHFPDLFRHACLMGLEGMVPKRADSRYRGGRSPDWIKVKNPKSPAMNSAKDALA